MKIAIVNKFFYPRGGDCIVAINTGQLLKQHGHQVSVFAMDYPENLPLPPDSAYAPRVDFAAGISGKLRGAMRIFGKGDIRRAAEDFLDSARPDVVHLHNVHSYLSPLIGELAHKRGIRVVWTLHDYKLLCPAYSCRRPDGSNCEDCIGGDMSGVVKYRCMKGSRAQSMLAKAEASFWNRSRLEEFTDCFIAPSEFMRAKMIQGGFDPQKVVTICNFIDPKKLEVFDSVNIRPSDYLCYVGRLSEEKGVRTLLKAAAKSGVKLKVAGGGPLLAELRKQYADHSNIEFLGHLDAAGVSELLSGATASAMPSECYENNPLGVIESLCAGTPVIGARIGGIPELIGPEDGIVYESGNVDELADAMRGISDMHFDRAGIAARASLVFAEQTHYAALMKAYQG